MSTAVAPPPPPPSSPRPAPPPPAPISRPAPNGKPTVAPVSIGDFKIETGVSVGSQKIVLWGSGSTGKTSLAASLAQVGIRPLFLDIENGSQFCDVSRINTIEDWTQLRSVLHNPAFFEGFDAVVIDSLTKAEEMATAWVLANVPHEKGHFVSSIEGYGFGKGLTHIYETFMQLIGDLDSLARRGKHIICTAHECVSNVPNPSGEDWIRYEPRLQSPASGKNSVRHRVKEWCDHMLFISFDTFVTNEGKAQGSGTRTIYPVEMPTHLAKSRSLASPIPYPQGSAELWKQLFKK